MKSSLIEKNHRYLIENILITGQKKDRLMAIGFIKNAIVEVIRKSRKNHLIVFKINGSMFALRKQEADLIEVKLWD